MMIIHQMQHSACTKQEPLHITMHILASIAPIHMKQKQLYSKLNAESDNYYYNSLHESLENLPKSLAYGANYRTVPIIERKNTEKFQNEMLPYASNFAIDWSFCSLNQQGKSSSFGRSSGSQKQLTTCMSVHGGGPSCQVCHILVSCQLFIALVIEYNCLNSFHECMSCYICMSHVCIHLTQLLCNARC